MIIGTLPLLILSNFAASTTTTKAIVKIKIKIGTPLTNSIYVRDKVLEILFFDIRPIPSIKPRKRAMMNETRVEPKVILRPGII